MDKVIEMLNEKWFDYITYKDDKYLLQYKAMIEVLKTLDIQVERKGDGHHERL